MRNIELHVMENTSDIGDGITAGLLEIEDIDGAECATCAEDVGHRAGTFYPYAVALDDKSQWNVCTDCAGPVIDSSPIQEDRPLYLIEGTSDFDE